MKAIRYTALLTTVIVVIGVAFIPRDVLFSIPIGLSMMVIYLTSFITSIYAILLYGDKEIMRGSKHREKPIGLLSLVDSLVFILIVIYIADFQHSIPLWVIICTTGSMGFFILYFLFAYLYNYVILEEDGLRINYFLMMKETYVKYDDIESITFGMLMNTFKMKVNGKRVFVDVFLDNSDKILNEIYRNTSREIHMKAFETLGTFFTMFLLKSSLKYLRYFDKQ